MKRFALLVAAVVAGTASQASAQSPPITMDEWRTKWMDADFVVVLPKHFSNNYPSRGWNWPIDPIAQYDTAIKEAQYDLRQVHLAGVSANDAGEALTMLKYFGWMPRRGLP